MNKKIMSIVFSDLDGTLLHKDRSFHSFDLQMLDELKNCGIPRVIATGRSVVSVMRVLPEDFPIDYLIFSSGAGIMDWTEKKLLWTRNLSQNETEMVFALFDKHRFDFMMHRPVPDNHHFIWFDRMGGSEDFFSRISLYDEYSEKGDGSISDWDGACQFLAVIPEVIKSEIDNVLTHLSGFTVIHTTSPLDGTSVWLEVFPGSVSKSQAAAWLCHRLSVLPDNCFALGNDFNDLDLLRWAGIKYVVSNAPEVMRAEFPVTLSFEKAGFYSALNKHLRQLQKSHFL